jgi:hypothetical protein
MNYIEHMSFHRLLDLHTNNVTIGLTNKRGLFVLQDHSLNASQKANLMQRQHCIIHQLTSKFKSIPIATAFARMLVTRDKLEKRCSMCTYLESKFK